MRGLLGAQILGRELTEIAARRRTYAVRACVVLLMLATYGITQHLVERAFGGRDLLGRGPILVKTLIALMSIAISVIMPAMAALSVTTEREQGTLVLLVLTPMTVINLVLQKYLTQLLAAGALCLLAAPLLAVGYALGGMDASGLMTQIAFVAVVSCQVAAFGLAASCLARSAVGAIVIAYVWVLLMHFSSIAMRWSPLPWWFHCSPYALFVGGQPLLERMLAPLGLALGMLAIARATLPLRLEAGASSNLDRAVKRVDAGFEALDARLFRLRPKRSMPDARPVLWREVNRSSFCSWRFMIRCLLPAMAGLVLLAVLGDSVPGNPLGMVGVVMAFFISCLFIAIVGASLVNRERSDQTLEVLLTTQLSPLEIVCDKMRALARLRWALIACLVLPLCVIWWQYEDPFRFFPSRHRFRATPWICAVECALYLSIFSWMAVRIGLRYRPVSRAVILSLVTILAWFLAIPVLQVLLGVAGVEPSGDLCAMLFVAFSPASVACDSLPRDLSTPAGDVVMGWIIASGVWWLLAFSTGRRAQRWLSLPVASAA